MASVKNLISQTAIYGISATIGKFINFLLTPYLTRLMSEGVYGEYNYLYSLIPFANVLLTMGMTTGFFRYVGQAPSDAQKRKLFMTLWLSISLLSLLFCSVGAAIVGGGIWLTVFGLVFVDNVAALPLSSLRAEGRAVYYTVVNVTSILVNVGLCVAFYTLIPGAAATPFWAVAANLVASVVMLLMLMPAVSRFFAWTFSVDVLRAVARYSLPLMAAGLLGVSSEFIDRQMLVWLAPPGSGFDEVGLYGSVAKLASLMIIFRQMYSLGAEPFFLQKFSKSDFERLNSVSLKYFIIAGLFIFLGITLFPDVFGLILGARFRVGLGILPLLLAANLFSGILINLSFWYKVADMTRIAFWVTLSSLVITVAMNWLLIPLIGYQGSAWARFCATAATVVICWALGQKYYPIKYDLPRIGFYFLVAGSIFALSYLTAQSATLWRWSANFLLLLSFVYIVNKKEKLWSPRKSLLSK
ncbi:MAG: polysaccharide biosynthesis C-terminal domain-containing protein [Mucinivorans sp.]